MTDHYTTLGLSSGASPADIKRAYRLLAARYHPDRNPEPQAVRMFRGVQTAYDVLIDPQRRHDYDENRRRNLLDDPLATAGEIWQAYFNPLIRPETPGDL
jgi:DnaJ-class molecular chaperone